MRRDEEGDMMWKKKGGLITHTHTRTYICTRQVCADEGYAGKSSTEPSGTGANH